MYAVHPQDLCTFELVEHMNCKMIPTSIITLTTNAIILATLKMS